MASFALLNEEKKILRRKEKELERQERINEIKAQPVPVHQGKWADASDDEELNMKAPISDSDTDSEHEAEITEAPPVQDWEQRETNGAKVPEKDQAAPAPGGKNKKEAKKPVKPDDEDLDAILGELGIDLPQESQGGASSSKKNRKKKDKEAENGEGEGTGGYPDAAKEEKAEKAKQAKAKEDEKKASKEKENGDNGDDGDEKVLDEAAKQAALEALKKKKAAAAKKGAPSDAVKAAAAEAKKRAEQKKTKKDKSMYDR